MEYSISEAAKKAGITASTIRYYEKEGLLPSIKRDKNGIRSITDDDLQHLKIVECLKATGIPIKDIRKFIDLCAEGDNSLQERYELFLDRKKAIQKQIKKCRLLSLFSFYSHGHCPFCFGKNRITLISTII